MGKQGLQNSIPNFKTLGVALSALGRGDLPKGTKLVIGQTSTRLLKTTKLTQSTFFEFKGSPAQFAKLCLKTASYDVRVEIEEATTEVPKAGGKE